MTGKWEKSGRNVKENPPDFLVPWLICFTAVPVQRANPPTPPFKNCISFKGNNFKVGWCIPTQTRVY